MTLNIILAWLVIISGAFGSTDAIRDTRILSQDHMTYLEKAGAGSAALMEAGEQKKRDEDFNKAFFSPWHREKPKYGVAEVERELRIYRDNPGYGENMRRRSQKWMDEMTINMGMEKFPDGGFKGIVVANSDLRVFPTHRPHFNRCEAGYCSYPFDNFQQSAVYANTPVYALHFTKDRAWVFVETGFTYGWLPAQDIATVNAEFIAKWESGRYLAPVKDKVPVYGEDGRHLFNAPLGTVFPAAGNNGETGIMVALRDQNGVAVIKIGVVPEEGVTVKPLPLNRLNMAKIANELINEPYGWGGLYRNRDCSAMIRDMFVPFGIWLPRNSRHQALEGGNFIDLSKMTTKEKERTIINEGVPYMTLLWRQGHIMLFIGRHEGEILVFHNFWSAYSKGRKGKTERRIVGHAAITTINPGSRSGGKRLKGGYLSEIIGMTVIGGRESHAARQN